MKRWVQVRQWLRLVGLALALALTVRSSHAQPAPSESSATPPAATLEQAKEQFRLGVVKLNSGDPAGALEDFLRSRTLVPSGQNTVNAAICLESLGRYDEALELYEEVVSRFAADLEEGDRATLTAVVASLTAKIGYLELSANVDGDVSVSGHPRGRLPFRSPLRVLSGQQSLRIVSDGYRPFETALELAPGQTRNLIARLEPLEAAPAERLAPAPAAAPPAPSPSSDRQRTVGWIVGAAGVTQLGLGLYFGARAIQLHSDGKDSEAGPAADISSIIIGTGVATTAVGAYLLLTAKDAPVTVAVVAGTSVELTGSF